MDLSRSRQKQKARSRCPLVRDRSADTGIASALTGQEGSWASSTEPASVAHDDPEYPSYTVRGIMRGERCPVIYNALRRLVL